ncbi:hypothetical protein HAX54_004570, partial [Datura stramonium]|nr:hypothetical protein [Datura stramonium]
FKEFISLKVLSHVLNITRYKPDETKDEGPGEGPSSGSGSCKIAFTAVKVDFENREQQPTWSLTRSLVSSSIRFASYDVQYV